MAILLGKVITLVTSTESPAVKAEMGVPEPTPGSVSMKYSILVTGPAVKLLAGTIKNDLVSVIL